MAHRTNYPEGPEDRHRRRRWRRSVTPARSGRACKPRRHLGIVRNSVVTHSRKQSFNQLQLLYSVQLPYISLPVSLLAFLVAMATLTSPPHGGSGGPTATASLVRISKPRWAAETWQPPFKSSSLEGKTNLSLQKMEEHSNILTVIAVDSSYRVFYSPCECHYLHSMETVRRLGTYTTASMKLAFFFSLYSSTLAL